MLASILLVIAGASTITAIVLRIATKSHKLFWIAGALKALAFIVAIVFLCIYGKCPESNCTVTILPVWKYNVAGAIAVFNYLTGILMQLDEPRRFDSF